MTEQHEQRYCIKFFQKLGDTQAETICKIQQAFGDDAMSNTRIKEWYNCFKDGCTSVDSELRSGTPSTSQNDTVIEQVQTLVMVDHHITVRELANETRVSIGSVHSILTKDLGMKRVSVKFLPKLLTVEQKQRRLEIAQDMLDNVSSNPNFLNNVITGYESWVYGYDPETKMQSSQWKHSTSPRPKKVWQLCSNVKVMLTVFFTPVGWCIMSTHYKAKPSQRSATRWFFVIFVMLCDANDWICGQPKRGSSIMITPTHSVHLIQTFVAKHNIPVVHHAPYSPNMAPCDFWLFPKLKMPLKGT
ncbi:protein GVQW3-like [Centruroides vittatus]|uniref:protein GVQW3-like n=1 Tax=Centruroides vittatus TaxID=120091 RepID=UPI0035108AC6